MSRTIKKESDLFGLVEGLLRTEEAIGMKCLRAESVRINVLIDKEKTSDWGHGTAESMTGGKHD